VTVVTARADMIHQLILAHPKPGMSEADFQRYWVEVHAEKFAKQIPQIRKYLVATRVPFGPEPADPLWGGMAEIWLANEEEQLASMQTPEFLDGARADEPHWAAFWRTVALDTDAYPVLDTPAPTGPDAMKLVILGKRKEGVPLDAFRAFTLDVAGPALAAVPGVRRYLQGHTRDGAYGIGEAVLDVAHQLWFDSAEDAAAAHASAAGQAAIALLSSVAEAKYTHVLAFREHWVLGPDPR
jgi:hypothetical protein